MAGRLRPILHRRYSSIDALSNCAVYSTTNCTSGRTFQCSCREVSSDGSSHSPVSGTDESPFPGGVGHVERIIPDIRNGEIGTGGSATCETSRSGCYGFGEAVVDMAMRDLAPFSCQLFFLLLRFRKDDMEQDMTNKKDRRHQ